MLVAAAAAAPPSSPSPSAGGSGGGASKLRSLRLRLGSCCGAKGAGGGGKACSAFADRCAASFSCRQAGAQRRRRIGIVRTNSRACRVLSPDATTARQRPANRKAPGTNAAAGRGGLPTKAHREDAVRLPPQLLIHCVEPVDAVQRGARNALSGGKGVGSGAERDKDGWQRNGSERCCGVRLDCIRIQWRSLKQRCRHELHQLTGCHSGICQTRYPASVPTWRESVLKVNVSPQGVRRCL